MLVLIIKIDQKYISYYRNSKINPRKMKTKKYFHKHTSEKDSTKGIYAIRVHETFNCRETKKFLKRDITMQLFLVKMLVDILNHRLIER